ncbi:MAG TPA: ribonuclease E activity regulator RraA [Gemmatimonadaceae bacterium]|jgi:regulator of ribonuclease activity A|nr:ribonuclease E activity regulator RraA [Gemmatimonadaceae bacterium]
MTHPVVPTADVCDREGTLAVVAEPVFRDYGGRVAFAGPAATVRVFDDNLLVRHIVSSPGDGRVLIVDGGGSRRCALIGDNLAGLAANHGWAGIIVFGCVRDAAGLATLPLGIKALATHPAASAKQGAGERDVAVTIAGITISPGAYVTADADGVVITRSEPRA